jgi:hypothetical protein
MVTGNFTQIKGTDKITVGNEDGLGGAVRILPDILATPKEQKVKYDIDFETVRGILIVERAVMFEFLRFNEFHTTYNVIIVTGCGMPDHATRVFVKQLYYESMKSERHAEIGVPVFAAGDCNPCGFVIVKKYEDFLGSPIHWIGAWPSDVRHAVTREDMHSHVQLWGDWDVTLMTEGYSVDQFAERQPSHVLEIAIFRGMGEKKCEYELLEHILEGLSIYLLSSRITAQIAANDREREDIEIINPGFENSCLPTTHKTNRCMSRAIPSKHSQIKTHDLGPIVVALRVSLSGLCVILDTTKRRLLGLARKNQSLGNQFGLTLLRRWLLFGSRLLGSSRQQHTTGITTLVKPE